jgi:hypothetical protein
LHRIAVVTVEVMVEVAVEVSVDAAVLVAVDVADVVAVADCVVVAVEVPVVVTVASQAPHNPGQLAFRASTNGPVCPCVQDGPKSGAQNDLSARPLQMIRVVVVVVVVDKVVVVAVCVVVVDDDLSQAKQVAGQAR